MWKLLIADDEPKIRRGLAKVLPWNEMGIQVVGEAENGLQALELAEQHQPDILFVDICMPFLDGLEFIERLGQTLERSIIIVISGHDEFRYAQQAVKLKVFDYILKPVIKSKLESVVLKGVELLEKTKLSVERADWMDQQLRSNSFTLRDSFLIKWLDGSVGPDEVIRNRSFFQLNWGHSVGMIVYKVIQNLDTGKALRVWNRELLEFAVKNIAEDMLRTNGSMDFTVFNDKKGHTVIIGPTDDCIQWTALGAKIQDKVESLLEKTILLEHGQLEEDIDHIPKLYNKLVKAIGTKDSLSPIVKLAKKFIERNHGQSSLTLADVAEGVQVSPTYLSKQLKRELGRSFIDYLTEVRIQKAIQLMNDPHVKVYEIAERVGYSSQHYFSSAFKKITGNSPMLFKKGMRS